MSIEDPDPTFDDYEPDEIDVETIDAFHLEGHRFCVSVQLSDKHDEVGRSFLVEFTLGDDPAEFTVLLEIEDLILSHVSVAPDWHVVLEVGGVTHHLRNGAETIGQGPEPFTNKLWHLDPETILLYGDEGTVCIAEGTDWVPIPPATSTFLRVIDGPNRDLIHAGGDHGVLLHLVGSAWVPIPLGFGYGITALQVTRDGDVYLGCEEGFCARYANEELVEIAGPGTRITSICEFRNERYWGDDDYGLFVQKGLTLTPFKPLGVVYTMHASHAFLVIAGWKEVFVFNGADWSGIEFGYDGRLFARRIDMTRDYD